MEKWEDEQILIFSHGISLGLEKWRDRKLSCLVEENSEKIENVFYMNLLLCLYNIK